MKKRLFLTFDMTTRNTPILSSLVSRFDIAFNIMGATINDETQCMAIELDGSEEEVEAALAYLDEMGVQRENA